MTDQDLMYFVENSPKEKVAEALELLNRGIAVRNKEIYDLQRENHNLQMKLKDSK